MEHNYFAGVALRASENCCKLVQGQSGTSAGNERVDAGERARTRNAMLDEEAQRQMEEVIRRRRDDRVNAVDTRGTRVRASSISVAIGGRPGSAGWPREAAAFERVMRALLDQVRADVGH